MNISLKANIRKETGKKLSSLRTKGLIPGIVYGKGIANVMVSIEVPLFNKIFKEAKENKLINLKIEGDNNRTVLIYDVVRDVIKNTPIHIDFHQVRLDEIIKTEIPLNFRGEAKAVRELNGTLIKQIHFVEVESLPSDIPQEIEVDISGLETFSEHITVGQLNVPSNVKILTAPQDIIASVVPPRTDKELEELKEEVVEEVEKVSAVTEDEEVEGAKESEPAKTGEGGESSKSEAKP